MAAVPANFRVSFFKCKTMYRDLPLYMERGYVHCYACTHCPFAVTN